MNNPKNNPSLPTSENVQEAPLSPENEVYAELSTILQNTKRGALIAENPVLTALNEQYDSLHPSYVDINKNLSWHQILDSIPNMDLFLEEIATFEEPMLLGIFYKQLFIGEGLPSMPPSAKGLSFAEATKAVSRVVYLQPTTNGPKKVTYPNEAEHGFNTEHTRLMKRGLISKFHLYEFIDHLRPLDKDYFAWLEGGHDNGDKEYAKFFIMNRDPLNLLERKEVSALYEKMDNPDDGLPCPFFHAIADNEGVILGPSNTVARPIAEFDLEL